VTDPETKIIREAASPVIPPDRLIIVIIESERLVIM
jgi:hypothetical protein